jgi:type II secretory pathway pseudopilin PulG
MLHRRGLTLVELVVALIIVVLLTGLILAAIAHVRASADLMTCRNNLKQLGLAVHNYNDTTGRLPPLVDQGEGAPTGRGLPSAFGTFFPFIEATPFVFRDDRAPDYYNAPTSVVFHYSHKGMPFTQVGGMANHIIRLFLDPADATGNGLCDIPMSLPDGATGYYATGSYAANGLLPWGVRGLATIPGGLANTVMFGERPQVCETATGETVYNLWGLGIYSPHMPAFAALTPANPPGLLSTEQIAPVEPIPTGDEPVRVRIGRRDASPESPDLATLFQFVRSGRPCDPRLPGTPHRNGMQVVMMDGSVRVFAKDTSPAVFWSACVPARPADDR